MLTLTRRAKLVLAAGAAIVLSGCAVDFPKFSFPGFRSMSRFDSDPDFSRIVLANKGRKVPVQQRLQVLAYLVKPGFHSAGEYGDWAEDFTDKLSALGCKAEPDSRNSESMVLMNKEGGYCLSQARVGSSDRYIVRLFRRGNGDRQHFYATVVHPNTANIPRHLAGLQSIDSKDGKLYRVRWATVALRGNTFGLLTVGRFESVKRAAQGGDQSAAPVDPQTAADESLDAQLDVLTTF
jgi:hypothetical protein